MTAIPNTCRRGAIYWFRRSRRMPSGNHFRPTVSLRTACPKAARYRAALLTAKFEELFVRLFGSSETRITLERHAARQVFESEFNKVLDALEDKREMATLPGYEYPSFTSFLDTQEEVYRYLAETALNGEPLSVEGWLDRVPHLDPDAAALGYDEVSNPGALWHRHNDETYDALSAQGIEPTIHHMEHGTRVRFEARLAAIREYRRCMGDPSLKYAAVPLQPPPTTVPVIASAAQPPAATTAATPPVPGEWAALTCVEAGEKFLAENPKLLGSGTGKRQARWDDKTLKQFRTALRLLHKSVGDEPFWSLRQADILELMADFDRLPPNHHKSPRHDAMSLKEIGAEAQRDIQAGKLSEAELGLGIGTMNRHFGFIRQLHDWMRRHVPQAQQIEWGDVIFADRRSAREQREAFSVELGRKIFTLPPWRGCESRSRRLKPGRQVFHDALYWVFPVLWYTGMRREEACKLQVTDIARDEDGVWYFDIADTEAGRVKTTSSRRRIPIADELLRLGFIDFVEAIRERGARLLFPELLSPTRKMGDSYYKQCWDKIRGALGETDSITLHGIRHMVADELKAAGVAEEIRADLLGHTLESETAGRYSKASRLAILRDAVNQIPVITSTLKPEPVNLP